MINGGMVVRSKVLEGTDAEMGLDLLRNQLLAAAGRIRVTEPAAPVGRLIWLV
jgi:hypothetical protein